MITNFLLLAYFLFDLIIYIIYFRNECVERDLKLLSEADLSLSSMDNNPEEMIRHNNPKVNFTFPSVISSGVICNFGPWCFFNTSNANPTFLLLNLSLFNYLIRKRVEKRNLLNLLMNGSWFLVVFWNFFKQTFNQMNQINSILLKRNKKTNMNKNNEKKKLINELINWVHYHEILSNIWNSSELLSCQLMVYPSSKSLNKKKKTFKFNVCFKNV